MNNAIPKLFFNISSNAVGRLVVCVFYCSSQMLCKCIQLVSGRNSKEASCIGMVFIPQVCVLYECAFQSECDAVTLRC